MTARLGRAALEAHRHPPAALATLFAAILADDEVDEHTELPARITLDHEPALLVEGYRISRSLWIEGDQPAILAALIGRLQRGGDLDDADRRAFKHARAKLKHLRFACALFGAGHGYPPVMDAATAAFGRLQDAYRTRDIARLAREARLCRLFLSAPAQALLRREHDRLRPASAAGFRAYVGREVAALAATLGRATLTGATFHAARKIASRQVSFYSTLLALRPDGEAHCMARSLAAINGLMGDEHDRLIERRAAGAHDYHRAPLRLSDDMRRRIAALVARYRASGLGGSAP